MYKVMSLKIAKYLTLEGIEPVRTVPDNRDPWHYVNWLYDDTPELRKALQKIDRKFIRKVKEK